MESDGGPAFPVPNYVDDDGDPCQSTPRGMMLRDYFAAKAMLVMFERSVVDDVCKRGGRTDADEHVQKALACVCYQFADAMLAARDAKP